jgi:transcription elongation factor
MDSKEYLERRVDDQINWYNNKSLRNQLIFKILRISEIIIAALIPITIIVIGFNKEFEKVGLILNGILGAGVSIIAGLLGLGQSEEHWIEYRTTCESLKKEKYLFETGVEPYNGENRYSLLVQRVETLISKENTNWAKYMIKPKNGENSYQT